VSPAAGPAALPEGRSGHPAGCPVRMAGHSGRPVASIRPLGPSGACRGPRSSSPGPIRLGRPAASIRPAWPMRAVGCWPWRLTFRRYMYFSGWAFAHLDPGSVRGAPSVGRCPFYYTSSLWGLVLSTCSGVGAAARCLSP
jgi:hypothetical protein